MIIDAISDLHGEFPNLDGGDLLIIAGDLTSNDTEKAWHNFIKWICSQNYKKIIFIGGNHDKCLEEPKRVINIFHHENIPEHSPEINYLCDSGTEFEGLKIWGSPWTKHFYGINEKCMAFVKWTDVEMQQQFDLIPQDTNILITHSPPYDIFDRNKSGEHCGSKPLLIKICEIKPRLHVFGHIHEEYGRQSILWENKRTDFVNASLMNGDYEFVNKPIRVKL